MSPPRPTSPRLAEPVVSPIAPAAPRANPADPLASFREIEGELRKFPQAYTGEDSLNRLLRGYFREARIRSSLTFGPTVLVVDDSPDLVVRDGAGICAEARIHEGKLSVPQPLRLGGFQALGGFFDFCSVDSDPAGKIHLKSCLCSLPKDSDITDSVLKGPLGQVFPEKKVHPIALEDLLKPLLATPSSEGELDGGTESGDPLLSALRSIQVKAEIPGEHWVDDPEGTPGGSCHPLTASLEAYLDVPRLKENLAEGLWKSLDFSGLERGSKALWPRFDLTKLPLPQAWSIPSGEADLELRYFPESGETRIQLRDLKAAVKIPNLFGESEIQLSGQAQMRLAKGGAIDLELQDLRIEAPLNAMDGSALPNFSATLSGHVAGTFKDGQFSLSAADLALHDLQLQTPESRPSPIGKSGLAWHGTLLGQGHFEYDAILEQWKRVELELNGDLAIHGPEGSLLSAEGIGLDLQRSSDNLTLQADALSLKYGAIALRPKFSIEIKPPKTADGDWSAQGNLKTEGIDIPLILGAPIEATWNAERGKIKADPIAFRFAERQWTRKGLLVVQWSPQELRGRLRLPDLPGDNALELQVKRQGESENLSGNFCFEPADLDLNATTRAKNLEIRGSFSTDRWSGLFAKPRMNLDAKVAGQLEGDVIGPLSAELRGSLSYSPSRRSVFLWLNPRRDSTLHLGPLALVGESRKIEAELPIKGTWQAVLLPKGILLGGRGVGIAGGEVRIASDSAKVPWIQGLTLLADQLWSVQNGIAYAGGDGIRLEGRVDAAAWAGSGIQGLGARKVLLVTDQLPLSSEAYWKLFAKSLKPEGAR